MDLLDAALIVGMAAASFTAGVLFHAQVVATVTKVLAAVKAEEEKLKEQLASKL